VTTLAHSLLECNRKRRGRGVEGVIKSGRVRRKKVAGASSSLEQNAPLPSKAGRHAPLPEPYPLFNHTLALMAAARLFVVPLFPEAGVKTKDLRLSDFNFCGLGMIKIQKVV